jgi:hypothetical protein
MIMSKHERYVKTLTPEERMLLTLRDELYKGEWGRMLKDLDERTKGRPYIFKLVKRIKEDITRIGKLQEYETKHGVNLMDHVPQ